MFNAVVVVVLVVDKRTHRNKEEYDSHKNARDARDATAHESLLPYAKGVTWTERISQLSASSSRTSVIRCIQARCSLAKSALFHLTVQKSALGRSQRAIAREEKINRESVGRIVRSEEAQAFAAEIRAQFRGLCDLAIESLRQNLQANGKEAIEIAWRVLETNGIIPPEGQTVNYLPHLQAASENEENDAVQKTLSAFGRIAMERARAFNTPFSELEEAAEQAGVRLNEE